MQPHVETAGSRDAPPIVFVHGAGGSAATWFMQLRGLSREFRVHAIELNGHGRTVDRKDRDTRRSYLEDIHSVVSTLDRPVLAGHSMGGALTQLYALLHPDQLKGIALIGTGARLRVAPIIFDMLSDDFDSYVKAVGSYMFDHSTDPRLIEATKVEVRKCPIDVITRDFQLCNEFDVMAEVAFIRNRTLIIVGESDQMTPVKYSEYLRQQIPNSELHVVPHAGHSVMLEQYKTVNGIISQWVASLPRD
ncbi:MAG: hypothetical protein DRO87_10635 [Candidatus Thorarchaeota archaeon]|nr:MAG: hypothetical protein DRO87_10635 [Candidatus Thorarchaeota archaeon]RLI57172.1 MAG: hypothetical protein DRP09_04005 [Candidatus Thorarchaeota archaeon]